MLNLVFFPFLVLSLANSASFVLSFPYSWSKCQADENEPWSYAGESNGPNRWEDTYPSCSGTSQSPIKIDPDNVQEDNNLEQLDMNNYHIPITKALIENNGHTIEVIPEDGVSRTITINSSKYALEQFHFHWGLYSDEGSEHIVGEYAYAMEMHLVHRNEDGLIAVVALFFEEDDKKNEELQAITNELSNLLYKNQGVQLLSNLTLNNLLPSNPASIFRYSGSLTTPGCSEGVTWSVIIDPVHVGSSQMDKFRKLYSVTKTEAEKNENEDCLIAPNNRPVQPLNGRQVYISKKLSN